MNDNINIPRKDWNALVKGVADIRNVLIGSGEMGTTGLIHQVQNQQKIINEFEALRNKGRGALWTLGISWVGLTAFFGWLFSK